MKKAYIMTFEG